LDQKPLHNSLKDLHYSHIDIKPLILHGVLPTRGFLKTIMDYRIKVKADKIPPFNKLFIINQIWKFVLPDLLP